TVGDMTAAHNSTSEPSAVLSKARRRALMEGTVRHLVMAGRPGFRNGRQFSVRIHVTGTGAVLQLADVVLHAIHGLVVALGLECAGVAAAASRTVGRKLPGRLISVGRVTRHARRGAVVVAGVFGRGMY